MQREIFYSLYVPQIVYDPKLLAFESTFICEKMFPKDSINWTYNHYKTSLFEVSIIFILYEIEAICKILQDYYMVFSTSV